MVFEFRSFMGVSMAVWFRIGKYVVLCCAVVILAACGQPEADAEDIAPPIVTLSPDNPVTVTGGQIRGSHAETNPSVMTFKGLPFAAAPIGDRRWRAPDQVEAWSGVRDATTAGPICIQDGGEDLAQSEDCLFLNVWAPAETSELLPVMVWIHGGGYTGGSGSTSLYDGTPFASRDVVLVSINYRLNVFGFMAHPALSAESEHDASGNYGLMDMVASLEWVRDNIASFGGDADRVTIFGESAGAGAVMSLMLMPQSDGLFHRAIAQSNWINGWDRQLREAVGDWDSAEAQGIQLAESLGADGEIALATMRAATAAEVKAAAQAGLGDYFVRTGYVWAPNVDGWTIPEDPLRMYDSGQQHNVPLITGMNGNEGSLMTQQMQIGDVDAFESHVRSVYPSIAEMALEHYQATSDESARAAIDHLIHDMFFAGPVRTQATTHVKVTSPVWLYHFTRVPPTDWGAGLGAHHAAELVYVFGTMTPRGTSPEEMPLGLTTEGDWTETDRELSETMMDYWVQFAATGNPNRDGLPQWTEFDGLTNHHLVLGDQVGESTGLHDEGAELFSAFEKGRRGET
jgi:para-nitrobenzyl esterase